MHLCLDRSALRLLDRMIRNPGTLGLQEVGPQFQQWRAKDEAGAKEILRLQKWLEMKVFERVSEDAFKIPEKWEGGLPQTYVDRLLEVVKYYEPLGFLPAHVQDYFNLRNALEGKTGEDKALTELFDYKEPEKKEEAAKEPAK